MKKKKQLIKSNCQKQLAVTMEMSPSPWVTGAGVLRSAGAKLRLDFIFLLCGIT